MKRNPLDKSEFMQTTRQKWLAILLSYGIVVLLADSWYEIDPVPYMSFIATLGTTFIIGSSIDSALKIQAATKKQSGEIKESELHIESEIRKDEF